MTQKARTARRQTVRQPATLTMTDETRHTVQTLDLSHGGISLQTDSQLRLAQYCAVSFKVQLGDTDHNVLAMGQIVYSDPDAELGFKTGVQFLRIDDDSRAIFHQLLQENQNT
ncbi:PilZ domain-containing protein [Duganella dendranthematis]|uniref:PilZ domain-containing protein n=1 Tax=Duganella dendranthematis TaxID=2728021 RepID=A0ABX6M451_9BURK|nr:PilZ domain-containing protein [Duganella dendranthematis]QJD89091.1 PilZ domain-containing protein [Duganella dendranthematis]